LPSKALFFPAQAAATLYISARPGFGLRQRRSRQRPNPDDFQVASNLACARYIPDPKPPARFCSTRASWLPSRRARVNLAWVYFNSGHTSEPRPLPESGRADPDLSGPPAGLGMLASSSGDTATAMSMFRSPHKSYSGVVAAGFVKAQQRKSKSSRNRAPTNHRFLSAQRRRGV